MKKIEIAAPKRFARMCERAFLCIKQSGDDGISLKGLAGRTGYTRGVTEKIIDHLFGAGRLECYSEGSGDCYRTKTNPSG